MINNFKFSIITVVFNSPSIERTIISINNQTYTNFEHIIIDGFSTDNTLELIKSISTSKQILYSEIDNGIYDAMNKGLKVCTGDFAIMLNAGDVLNSNNTLEKINDFIFDKNHVYYTQAAVLDNNHRLLYIKPFKSDLVLNRIKNFPIHQSVIVPKIYFNLQYDTNFSICSDSLYLIELFKRTNPIYINFIGVNFYIGGISNAYKTIKELKLVLKETLYLVKIYEKNILYNSIKVYIKFYIKYLLNNLLATNFILKLKNFK
jgi:glycosyltransferase involved in cell wall biosynthesis